MAEWNPWHGCHKISSGCLNCYVYRGDGRYGKDSSIVIKNADFDLPLRKNRNGEYKLRPKDGLVYTCFTSDLLLEDADPWRAEIWQMMKIRSDLRFLFITKRIHRLQECLPTDWDDGYDNVAICCTCENQERADYRLPIFLAAPIKYKEIICEPLLGPIDLSKYLNKNIRGVIVGGESGPEARVCNYDWIMAIREQCQAAQVRFYFKQTGANFVKDNKHYFVARKFQHQQARKAKINLHYGKKEEGLL